MAGEGLEDEFGQRLVEGHGLRQHLAGNDPLDEIVDPLERAPLADGEFAGSPQGAGHEGGGLELPGAAEPAALEVERTQWTLGFDPPEDLGRHIAVFGDKLAPSGSVPELLAAEIEERPVPHRLPAGLVAEALEERLARLEEILDERRIKAIEPRHEHQPLGPRAGHTDGIELEIAEPTDDLVTGPAGGGPTPPRGLRHTGPLGFQEACTSEGEPTGLTDRECFHGSPFYPCRPQAARCPILVPIARPIRRNS